MASKTYTVDKSKPVCVTGATGYVAGQIIRLLLEEGVTVHATVRDPSKKNHFQYLQDIADATKGSIKFFRGDLLEIGSFADALKSCAIVFHTASPFSFSVDDPQKELIEPAVKGTENVLNEATKTGTVKRVVLTSSTVAVNGHAADTYNAPNHVLTEECWNRTSTITDGPYSLSKTLAEQKAWEMAGSQTQWDLVTINPSLVLGPGLKVHEKSESFLLLKKFGDGTFKYGVPKIGLGVVDVRDVAQAHVAAGFIPTAKGRHILTGHNIFMGDIGKSLRKKYYPDYPIPPDTFPIPKIILWLIGPYAAGLSRNYIDKNVNVAINLDGSKATRELGIQYRSLDETCIDMFEQLITYNIVKK